MTGFFSAAGSRAAAGWGAVLLTSVVCFVGGLASLAVGASGRLLEAHPNARRALSDGAQALSPDELTQLAKASLEAR